jgi:transcriptional repressor NrdR
MKCPHCGHEDSRVIDSRPINENSVVRRRRECLGCKRRFTTHERFDKLPLMVIKSDGRREEFDRNKVREGILRACEKRPISIDTIDGIVNDIEYKLQDYIMEVPSSRIGKVVLKKLYDLDEVAYVRFASVYRQFASIGSFRRELARLEGRKNSKQHKKALKKIEKFVHK